LNYSGTVALEYEKDEKDPLPGAAESIGYIRGVLAMIYKMILKSAFSCQNFSGIEATDPRE
jgi:hypothetical protein